MKKLIAVVTLAAIMMFAGIGTAFAAVSPDSTPNPVTPTITGTTNGGSGTLIVTPDPNNPDGGPTDPITVTVNDDGTFTIDGLTFTKPGTYTFTVTDPNDPNTSYTLEVVVGDDGSVTYSFKDANGNEVSTLNFGESTTPVVGGSKSSSSSSGKAAGSGTIAGVKTSDIPKYVIGLLACAAAVAAVVTGVSRRRASQF